MSTYRLHQEGEKEFVLKDAGGDPVLIGTSPNDVRDELVRMMSGLGLPLIDDRAPAKKKKT